MSFLNSANTSAPLITSKDEDIVQAISNNRFCDVGSPYPGAEEGPKGLAVRQLKGYASWVQTVVRQVGLYLLSALILEGSRL